MPEKMKLHITRTLNGPRLLGRECKWHCAAMNCMTGRYDTVDGAREAALEHCRQTGHTAFIDDVTTYIINTSDSPPRMRTVA